MTTKEVILGRRSIRKYSDKPVDDSLLQEIVEEASYAPSWKHTQITRYICVKDAALKDRIAQEGTTIWPGNGDIIRQAPVLTAVCVVKNRSGFERDGSFSTKREDRWEFFDAGIASQTFCLAAYEHGLGSVILGLFDIETVSKLLEVPEGQELIALIPLGYPAEEPVAPKRKAVSDLLTIR
ncbi:MAG: nitroreductase family protein [Lachnospiraceae bacterium]|nr:nitroreductase family protein [Lachnospiraceae bacterium]